jgi:hypothetical protein
MPTRSPTFEDAAGRTLSVVWSRSGKTLGAAITSEHPWTYLQAGLNAAQVKELAAFLLEGPPRGRPAKHAPEPAIELEDPDGNGMLTRAAWTKQGRRLLVTVVSAMPLAATPREAELDGDQAQSLGRYLSKGPRPPG